MPYIKEIIMHGFKSFARETKIPFKPTMNVIVGPNGAGKSNVTDAICFVLGRLGSKSMRAKRLSNLIFAGTQKYKPASEAGVEMIFDNSDREFSLDADEVSIKRILRKNGQGIYKINNEIRTRQEVLELLNQVGIDPNGFNIVLQGEIDSFVKMHPEQRREVIEEVAGIAVYEIRKGHSLRELEKTDNKLKEVGAILRERTSYLKNLEEERKQAMHFQKLQAEAKSFKASIFHRICQEKQDKIDEINIQIEKHQQEIAKIAGLIEKNNQEISGLTERISHISENIQKQSGLEQEKLNTEIADLRADLAGLIMKKQNAENKINETLARKADIAANIERIRDEISELVGSERKSSEKKLGQELDEKKARLDLLDEKKRKFLVLKSNLSSLESRIDDKKSLLQKTKSGAELIFERIQELESLIKIKEPHEHHKNNAAKLKISFEKIKADLTGARKNKAEHEKSAAVFEKQIQELEKIKAHVSSYDICPLCKAKMTKEHVSSVMKESEEHQEKHRREIECAQKAAKEIDVDILNLLKAIERTEQEISARSQDILRIEIIDEKKQTLRELSEEQKQFEKELEELEKRKISLEKQILLEKTSEENYDSLRLDVQELERRQEKDIGLDIAIKQRETERLKNAVKQAQREIEDAKESLDETRSQIEEKQALLDEKNEQDLELKRKFKKALDEKNECQEKIRFFESDVLYKQNNKHLFEEKINILKIQRAEFAAQKEAIESEANAPEFRDAKIIKLPVEELRKKLEETQRTLDSIGSVNLRSLEVYEGVKAEYEKIQEKANVLVQEKQEILKIIDDIDKKKKKVFLTTLKEINLLFSRNFSQLSTKGTAMLEPTNQDDIFAGGIEMLIRVGKGKYFDTHSLSGGEKSLISLALIFAIQEYKPYCFYIFDEIDAALDKKNSELLANLLKRYMKNGQYIVITHNDSLITEAPTIYGVVMQDKISSIFSMEV